MQGLAHASSRFHLSVYAFNPGPRAPDQPAGRTEGAGSRDARVARGSRPEGEPSCGRRSRQRDGAHVPGPEGLLRDHVSAGTGRRQIPPRRDSNDPAQCGRAGQARILGAARRRVAGAPRRRLYRADLDAGAAPQLVRRNLDRHCVRFFGPGADGDQLGTTREHRRVATRRGRSGADDWRRASCSTEGLPQSRAVRPGRPTVPDSTFRPDASSSTSSVVDVQGKVLDTELRDFDVPDLRSQRRGPMLLFPEVVRTRTLKDFHAAVADPDAAPSSAAGIRAWRSPADPRSRLRRERRPP